ncbi:hypothetical protein AZE42_05067, partial [Rhizopogon vesiculosus]
SNKIRLILHSISFPTYAGPYSLVVLIYYYPLVRRHASNMSTTRFPLEDSQLIHDLHRLSEKSLKLVRSTMYSAPSDPSIAIRSWKMNEFKYYDVPSPFPTLARGLFSRETPSGNDQHGEQTYQIVARGYDKFFNIGEVPWTDWSSLSHHTGPTYTLSLKSNGCIVFIAPISISKLVVTSKHALGPQGVAKTHSEVGHRWLKKHLADKGKTEERLAADLWEKRWTAVAEVYTRAKRLHLIALTPAALRRQL